MRRRQIIKLLSSLPLLFSLPTWAQATKKNKETAPAKPLAKPGAKADKAKKPAVKMLSEKDTLAKAMQYRADASKAPAMRTNKSAFCDNCAKYNICMSGDKTCKPLDKKALAKADAAPCQIFKEAHVAKQGWCLSWQAKA